MAQESWKFYKSQPQKNYIVPEAKEPSAADIMNDQVFH